MKIKLLRVESLKKVKYLEFEPEDNVIVISGKNGTGKTSVLDAIMYGLTGGAGMKDISKPIREGQDFAEVILKIDDFTVKRNWTSNDRSLTSLIRSIILSTASISSGSRPSNLSKSPLILYAL